MNTCYPKIKDSKEFESLCRDVLNKKYEGSNCAFQLYGRNGQWQQGIDIVSLHPTTHGGYITAQCKDYLNGGDTKTFRQKIMKDTLMVSDLKFEGESIQVDKFYILTALDRDTKLQELIALLDQTYSFEIEILFWDDIEEFIGDDSNLEKRYYPKYSIERQSTPRRRANGDASIYRDAWIRPLFLEKKSENRKRLCDMHMLPNYELPIYPGLSDETKYCTPGNSEKLREITYSEEQTDLASYISEIIQEKRLCVILGLPGIGKSTLFTWLLNQNMLVEEKINTDNIFVFRFVDFEDLFNTQNESKSTKEQSVDKVESHAEIIAVRLYDYLQKKTEDITGKVILLDGFDEISCEEGLRELLLTKIQLKLQTKCACFITCRQNYMQKLDAIRNIRWIRLCPFTVQQIHTYINEYLDFEISQSLREILLSENTRDVFGLPVVLYMTLAVLATKEKESLFHTAPNNTSNYLQLKKITRYDVYGRIFSLKGGIYDRMRDVDTTWNSSGQALPDNVDAMKLDQVSEKLAIWMFTHHKEACPRSVAKRILEESKLPVSGLGGTLFKLSYLEISGDHSYVWKEVCFVHKSIYEYFVAKAIVKAIAELVSGYQDESKRKEIINNTREKLCILLMTDGLQTEKEISDFVSQKMEKGSLIPLTRCFETMLVQGMIDYNNVIFYNDENYRSLSFWQRQNAEIKCFWNMLFLLQIARYHSLYDSEEQIFIPLNIQDPLIKKGIENYLRFRSKGDYSESNLLNYLDLHGCCFDYMNLSGYDLSEANLRGCTFKCTDLVGTTIHILEGAWNSDCFAGANLLIRNSETTKVFDKVNELLYPGNLIAFGHYPNTSKSIYWRVLDIIDGAALLLADQVLFLRKFNEDDQIGTWAESSLCRWLNTFFYNEAFAAKEKSRIVRRCVKAEVNPYYDETPAGEDIYPNSELSKVFLLSIQEVCRYFGAPGFEQGDVIWDEDDGWIFEINLGGSQAEALGQRVALSEGWWWLRSPGRDNVIYIAFVDNEGLLNPYGTTPSDGHGGVRPALWLKI